MNCFKTNEAQQKCGHPFVPTMGQREKKSVLGVFYCNIYRTLKVNFR